MAKDGVKDCFYFFKCELKEPYELDDVKYAYVYKFGVGDTFERIAASEKKVSGDGAVTLLAKWCTTANVDGVPEAEPTYKKLATSAKHGLTKYKNHNEYFCAQKSHPAFEREIIGMECLKKYIVGKS